MKNIINDKKAEMTSEEVVKIILAVIGIGILLYLAWSLYGIFSFKRDIVQAKASLETLYNQIHFVEIGEKNNIEVLIESPNKWWVIAWPYEDGVSDELGNKPIQCIGDYCICLCPIPILESKDNSLENCNDQGICKSVSKPIMTLDESNDNEPLKIKGPISLNVLLKEGKIIIKKIKNEK